MGRYTGARLPYFRNGWTRPDLGAHWRTVLRVVLLCKTMSGRPRIRDSKWVKRG